MELNIKIKKESSDFLKIYYLPYGGYIFVENTANEVSLKLLIYS